MMVLDAKITAVKDFFGIDKLADWRDVRPEWIVGMHGIGQVTLDHIRMYLAAKDVTLADDMTPAYWREHYADARVCHQMDERGRADVAPFTVLIDTREQLPFRFTGINGDADSKGRPLVVPTEPATLASGDYSVKGLADRVAIERKNPADLFACIGRERERFEREIERLNQLDFAAVVTECGWQEILINPPERTKLDPKSVLRTIAAWSVRYPRVQWFPMSGRMFAERWTFRLLQRCYVELIERPAAAKIGAEQVLMEAVA